MPIQPRSLSIDEHSISEASLSLSERSFLSPSNGELKGLGLSNTHCSNTHCSNVPLINPVMTTSSLIARLQQGLTEHRDIKPEQLFKRVEAQCLDKIIQLSPKKGAGPSLQLSSRTLMTTFGNQFRIKGSAVSRFMTPMNKKYN